MAEALCGPSNALSSFSKHTQVDRTLQQDRLASRQPSHENFRSSPLSHDPAAQAEFDAFQRGLPPGASLQHSHAPSPFLTHSHSSAPLHHSRPLQPGLPAWANDFQNLSIHEARQSPIPAAHFRHEAPLQRSSPGPWQAEFMRDERMATPPLHAAHSQGPLSPSFAQPSYMGMGSLGMGSGFGQMGVGSGSAMQMQGNAPAAHDDMFDDAAFAAAFDNAAAMFEQPQASDAGKGKEREAEPMAQTPAESLGQAQETHQSPLGYHEALELLEREGRNRVEMVKAQNQQEEMEAFDLNKACVDAPDLSYSHYDPLEDQFAQGQATASLQERVHDFESQIQAEQLADSQNPFASLNAATNLSQVGQQESMQDEQQQKTPEIEADELSRTAGQLLDHLKHEQSEKFAKSNFMTLMRQLRDKEVRVDGERFVEVSEQQDIQEPDHGSLGEFSARVWE